MPLQKIPISKRAVDWFFGYDYFIALNRYSEIFTPEDLDALEQSNLKPNSYAVTPTERRCLRALAVITKAKQMARSGSLASLKPAISKIFGSPSWCLNFKLSVQRHRMAPRL
jgi:hypothetical protein